MMLNVVSVCMLVVMVTGVLGLQPCCVSKRFYGQAQIIRGELVAGTSKTVSSTNKFFIEFDADLQMELLKGTYYEDENDTVTNYIMWNDFLHDRVFTQVEGGRCTMEPLKDEITPYCVPSELKYEGSAIFGSGSEVMHINSWAGMSASDGLNYSMQTAVDDCTPVFFSRLGTDNKGNGVVEMTKYFNITQYSHSSSHVFDIPMDCMQLVPGH